MTALLNFPWRARTPAAVSPAIARGPFSPSRVASVIVSRYCRSSLSARHDQHDLPPPGLGRSPSHLHDDRIVGWVKFFDSRAFRKISAAPLPDTDIWRLLSDGVAQALKKWPRQQQPIILPAQKRGKQTDSKKTIRRRPCGDLDLDQGPTHQDR